MEVSSALEKMPSVRGRLAVWLIEIIIQVFAFCLLILWIGHEDRPIGLSDIVVGCYVVLYIFGLSGYLITTLLVRVFLTGQNPWLPSIWLTALFLIHFEVLNRLILPGGVAGLRDRTVIRLIGACITFLTTFAGPIALRRWRKSEKSLQPLF
jgi:hypothetical protein